MVSLNNPDTFNYVDRNLTPIRRWKTAFQEMKVWSFLYQITSTKMSHFYLTSVLFKKSHEQFSDGKELLCLPSQGSFLSEVCQPDKN